MIRIFIILMLASSNLFSQNIEELENLVKKNAEETSQAVLKEDKKTMLKYTHPSIVSKYGEKELSKTMGEVFDAMKIQKIKIVSSEITEIGKILKENEEYHCLVKNDVLMDFAGQKVKIKTSLFGFYKQDKKQWYFIESNKLVSDEETKKLFPNFKTEITIPKDEQIVVN